MNNFYLLLISLIFCSSVFSQTVVYFEDFEGVPDVTATGNPTWTINSSLQYGGSKSAHDSVAIGDTARLTTVAFSTVGNTFVTLEFAHICKIEFIDAAKIEVSVDSGSTWIALTETEYTGSGIFSASTGNKFTVIAYGTDWKAADDNATPDNTWWKEESFNISSIVANQANVMLRFVLYDGNNNGAKGNYGWLLDNIEVTVSPSELNDPTITMQTPILEGTVYSTGPYSIYADITDDTGIDSAYVIYSLNGVFQDTIMMGNVGGDTYLGVIDSAQVGDTICYYVVAVDSSAAGNSSISPSAVSCYEFIVDNSKPSYCDSVPVYDFTWTEDFEDFTDGSTVMINGWENDTGDDFDWEINSGSTSTSNTGPSGDHTTGNGLYIYSESSSHNNETAYLVSPCLDFTKITAPVLNFWYHMYDNYGSYMGDLHLDIYYLGQWYSDIMTPISGNQGDEWHEKEIDLSAYANDIVKLRFRSYITNSFYSDIALDDIMVFDRKDYDATVQEVLSPVDEKCQLTSTENITIVVKNYGIQNLDTIPVAYQIDNGSVVQDTLYTNIASTETDTFTFTTTADLSSNGTYTLNIWTALSGDEYVGNDTLSNYEVNSNAANASFPWEEDFETFSTGTPGTLMNDWENEIDDEHDWYVVNGSTGSSNTGPSGDHTTGNGNYMYIEASSHTGDTAILLSPCLNISGLTTPTLKFWYHMYGTTMGNLHVDIVADGVLYPDVILISGDQGDQWFEKELNLSAYSGNISFKFRGVVGSNYYSDMSIDDITVYDKQPYDVEMLSLDNPFINCGLSTSEPITVTVLNTGIETLDLIPVSYQVNGGTIVQDTIVANLASGDSAQFSFNTTYDFSVLGTYLISVWTEYGSDSAYFNDSIIEFEFNHDGGVGVFPFKEDFDGFTVGTTTLINDWTNETDDDGVDWEVEYYSTTTSNTGPSGDHTSGTGNYLVVDATGNYNLDAYVTSPCIDISALANPTLDFWYHMYDAYNYYMGELHLDIFSNGAWDTDVMTPVSGNQGDEWIKASIDLSNYSNSVKIRFRAVVGTSAYSDIAIDDIRIYEMPKNDLGVVSIDVQKVGCDFSSSEIVTVSIANYGAGSQVNFPVYYSFDNGTAISETVGTLIEKGDTISYSFTSTIDLSDTGSYNISSWTGLSGDTLINNDSTIDVRILSILPFTKFPFYETFDDFDFAIKVTEFERGWYNDPEDEDGAQWRTHKGATPNDDSGPYSDHTTGLGNYLYIDSDSSYGSSEVNLISPCIDLNGVTAPYLAFWYHMYGSYMGDLHIDINSNGNWNNDVISALSGNKGSDWNYKQINLSAYEGKEILVRFRGDIGFNDESDIAIDDISVLPTISVGAFKINPTINGSALPVVDDAEINIKLINSGKSNLGTCNITLQIDDSIIGSEALSFNPILEALDTFSFTFSDTYFMEPGLHEICIMTDSPNGSADGYIYDDTLCVNYVTFDTISTFPYCNNFENSDSINEWVTLNAHNFKNGNNTWEKGTPSQTQISGAYSGSNAWMINVDGNYSSLDSSGLFPPIFLIDSLQCYTVSFWHSFSTEKFQDGGTFEFSVDNGVSWYQLGYPYETDWMNSDYVSALNPVIPVAGWTGESNGWIFAEHDFYQPSSGSLLLRFRFGSDVSVQGEGWAVDDFCIEEKDGICDFNSVKYLSADKLYVIGAYPNPTKDELTIQYFIPEFGDVEMIISDMLGKTVYQQNMQSIEGLNSQKINLNSLTNGVYYYTILFEGESITGKLSVVK